jgi:hypothetical protein
MIKDEEAGEFGYRALLENQSSRTDDLNSRQKLGPGGNGMRLARSPKPDSSLGRPLD